MNVNNNAISLLYTSNSLSTYLIEISKFPMLEPEQEYMLAKRYRDCGDLEAAHQLTTSHLRLAAKIAFSFKRYGLALCDLISEANIGLMQAIKKFDPDKGFRLATYAIWWIKATVSEFVLKSWSLVKIGTVATQKRLFYNLHKIKSKLGLFADSGVNNETAEKIANALGVSPKEVIEMEQRLAGDSSLNTTLSDDSATNKQDMLVDSSDTAEEILVHRQDLDIKKELLSKAIDTLNDREKIIFSERFLSDSPTTLEDLGIRFSVSRERIRQIEAKAYKKVCTLVKESALKLAI